MYTHLFALAARPFKGDIAITRGKQGIITTNINIQTRVKFGAMLANQDIPGAYLLACEALDAQAL